MFNTVILLFLILFQKYYPNETKLNGLFTRNNLPKIKDGTYVINLDEYWSIGTHLIALYVNDCNVIYFDSFDVECISKEIKKIIRNKSNVTHIYRIQAYDSVMCVYFYVWFIDFMVKVCSIILIYSPLMNIKKNIECPENLRKY